MSQIDVANAKKALATRLRMWGIGDEAASLAAGFIDDLTKQGWAVEPFRETRRQPPQPHEECGKHPGQYRLSCGGCAADAKAVREEAEAVAAEQAATNKADALAACRAQVAARKGWTTTEEETA